MEQLKELGTKLMAILTGIFAAKFPEVKDTANQYVEGFQERAKNLIENRQFLDAEDWKTALAGEVDILKSELLSFEQIAAQEAQEAINSAVDLFAAAAGNIELPKI